MPASRRPAARTPSDPRGKRSGAVPPEPGPGDPSADPRGSRTDLARVTLSSSSVYPLGVEAAFDLAQRLGYDGVEVMVLAEAVTQNAAALRKLSRRYDLPILSIHAPTLLLTQRVWGTSDPWTKIDRSIDLAVAVGAETVVVHPPFRWQKEYAATFVDGIGARERGRRMPISVENMFPWRAARGAQMQAYLPHWDPVPLPFENVTLDLSHTATAGSDALAMQAALGARLRHIHLADGSGSMRDEHLVPGRGNQPCSEFLNRLAGGDGGFDGVVAVEVGTRRLTPQQREVDLAESLAFARLHLGQSGLRVSRASTQWFPLLIAAANGDGPATGAVLVATPATVGKKTRRTEKVLRRAEKRAAKQNAKQTGTRSGKQPGTPSGKQPSTPSGKHVGTQSAKHTAKQAQPVVPAVRRSRRTGSSSS